MAIYNKYMAAINGVVADNDEPITLQLIDPNTLTEGERKMFNNGDLKIVFNCPKPFKVTIATRYNDVETSEPYSKNEDYDSSLDEDDVAAISYLEIRLKAEVENGSYFWLYNINQKIGSDNELFYLATYDNTIVISTSKVCLGDSAAEITIDDKRILTPFTTDPNLITLIAGIVNVTYAAEGIYNQNIPLGCAMSVVPMNLNAAKKIAKVYTEHLIATELSPMGVTINSVSYKSTTGEEFFNQ